MNMNERIKQFILTEVCPDANITEIGDAEPLISSGILDSLGILKILSFLDEEFGIDLSSDEIKHDNFSTVNSICELITKNSAG
ncbi:MAG TPA: phosphopantetheine-binding protein [Thermodesulfobacteriota bacterium]|nr:phosphopantetheine-binding protein [Thermodesulfobacteriota bacterium]